MKYLFLISLFIFSGCLVEEKSYPGSKIVLSIVFPNGYKSAFHNHKNSLKENEIYIFASLKGDDLAKESSTFFQGTPDKFSGSLELDINSGSSRKLSVTAFVLDGTELTTYGYYNPDLDISGETQTLEIDLQTINTFKISGILENFETKPDEIALMDVQTGVIFPKVTITDTFNFTFNTIPIGRFFYFVPYYGETQETPIKSCPVYFSEKGTLNISLNLTSNTCQ